MSEIAYSEQVETSGTYEVPRFVNGERTVRLESGSTPETIAEKDTSLTVTYGAGVLVVALNSQVPGSCILHKDDSFVVEAGATYFYRTIGSDPFDVFESVVAAGMEDQVFIP